MPGAIEAAFVRVQEGDDGRHRLQVVVDDVCQVCHGFVAFVGRHSQAVGLGAVGSIHDVDCMLPAGLEPPMLVGASWVVGGQIRRWTWNLGKQHSFTHSGSRSATHDMSSSARAGTTTILSAGSGVRAPVS